MTLSSISPDPELTAVEAGYGIPDLRSLRWAWTCRHLSLRAAEAGYHLLTDRSNPRPADVAVVRVEKVGHHHFIETAEHGRLRIYEGDSLIGVFGNRYATDVYEGRVHGLKKLHLLTASGVVGTVVSRHRNAGRPTSVSFTGYLGDGSGQRINLKQALFAASASPGPLISAVDLVLVIGTGMNCGKTTVARKILRALTSLGVPVAGCKLTGTASPRDLSEMRATGAIHATDFSEYGFPSTYGEAAEDLVELLDRMTGACALAGARIAVVEIADGLLQRETRLLLESEEIRRRVRGVVVAGACSSSLLFVVGSVTKNGFNVWAASGLITNSPLFMREFSDCSSIPVVSSRGSGTRLTRILVERLAIRKERKPKEKVRLAR
jgi:hypothetical protein